MSGDRYRVVVYNIHGWLKMPVMHLHQVNEVFSRTDIVVIGHNPENADFSNPRGAIFGHAALVIAVAPDGSQWEYIETRTRHTEREALEAVEPLVRNANKRLANGGSLNPQFWREMRPMYGSEAYDKGGWSRIDAEMERLEDEFFYDR